jgi:hypothetical protein
MMGTFLAKSILDDRLIDLPISQQMWDLVFDRQTKSIYDVQYLDRGLYEMLIDLQMMANRKREIDEMDDHDPEQRSRLYQTIKSSVCQTFCLLTFVYLETS